MLGHESPAHENRIKSVVIIEDNKHISNRRALLEQGAEAARFGAREHADLLAALISNAARPITAA